MEKNNVNIFFNSIWSLMAIYLILLPVILYIGRKLFKDIINGIIVVLISVCYIFMLKYLESGYADGNKYYIMLVQYHECIIAILCGGVGVNMLWVGIKDRISNRFTIFGAIIVALGSAFLVLLIKYLEVEQNLIPWVASSITYFVIVLGGGIGAKMIGQGLNIISRQ